MVKSITLPNGKTWTTQKEALEHFKSLLGRYEDGETVNDLEDHDDLVALLERYDQLELGGPEKIGAGVDHFERRRNRGEGYSSSGFWAIRTNGTETDFSCPKAVRGVPTALPSCFRPPQPVEVWDVDPVFYASPEGLSFSA
ncbi:hypothetical protein A3753_18740 [Sulfitobacter sp. HI0082]|nr:hypothetical protein A3753_23135 [Sulfitobacter sp. HI0082]KZZ23759.1 hypothetical protein A3753_18740 [Sulfitobacter sp. HI0082]